MLEYTIDKTKKILLEPLLYFTLATLCLISVLAIFAPAVAIPVFVACGAALFFGTMIMGRKC